MIAQFGIETGNISFFQWFLFACPLSVINLIVLWVILALSFINPSVRGLYHEVKVMFQRHSSTSTGAYREYPHRSPTHNEQLNNTTTITGTTASSSSSSSTFSHIRSKASISLQYVYNSYLARTAPTSSSAYTEVPPDSATKPAKPSLRTHLTTTSLCQGGDEEEGESKEMYIHSPLYPDNNNNDDDIAATRSPIHDSAKKTAQPTTTKHTGEEEDEEEEVVVFNTLTTTPVSRAHQIGLRLFYVLHIYCTILSHAIHKSNHSYHYLICVMYAHVHTMNDVMLYMYTCLFLDPEQLQPSTAVDSTNHLTGKMFTSLTYTEWCVLLDFALMAALWMTRDPPGGWGW